VGPYLQCRLLTGLQGVSLGIADGVGGWIESGVDPSLFSQALMYHAHRYAKAGWAGEPEIDPTQDYAEREQVEGWELTPTQCMEMAHGGVIRERGVLAGSSTACIVNLNASTGILRAAKCVLVPMFTFTFCLDLSLINYFFSLGDGGFCIIRSSSVIHFQDPQTHYFNCPK
jgi:protein phosphatase PTC7